MHDEEDLPSADEYNPETEGVLGGDPPLPPAEEQEPLPPIGASLPPASEPPPLRAGDWVPAHLAGDAPPERAPEDSRRCVIMGRGGCGKSLLADSVGYAIALVMEPTHGYHMTFLGISGTAQLTQNAVDHMSPSEEYQPATDVVLEYRCQVTVTQPGGLFRAEDSHSVELSFFDGPGGAIFGDDPTRAELSEWEEKMVREGSASDSIMLCVDPTNPNQDELLATVARILEEMSEDRWVEAPFPRNIVAATRWLRLYFQGGRRPPLEVKRCLRAKRFLIVLTKIDALLAGTPTFSAPSAATRVQQSQVNLHQLAEELDIVPTAVELLGPGVLAMIHKALPPGGQLAVSLSSAGGFDRGTGQPFLDRSGRRVMRAPGEDPGARLTDWRPYGVAESIAFCMSGIPNGPVQVVELEDLRGDGARPTAEAPLSHLQMTA